MIRIAWNELFCQPLPEGHRFPMEKYRLVPERLIAQGIIRPEQLFSPAPATDEDLLRVHSPDYVQMLRQGLLPAAMVRRIGFPLNDRLVRRELSIVQGTMDAVGYALEDGLAFNTAGGTHHAFADRGEAYCLLNDVALGAAAAIHRHGLERVLILDLDVHQGNGTAAIFGHSSQVYTFSMHEGKAWPPVKQRSHRDVELPGGMQGAQYLDVLEHELRSLADLARPQLMLYVSGVDVLAGDKLGGLALSPDDCRQRDRMVFEWCRKQGLPCVTAMGGGYHRDRDLIVSAHCATFEEGMRSGL